MNQLFAKPMASLLVFCLLVGLIGTGFASTASANGESTNSSGSGGYQQNQFFISTVRAVPWHDVYTIDDYRAVYQATKEAGFNLIENGIMPRTRMLDALDVCEELQIKCMAQNITNDNGFSGSQGDYPPFTEASIQSVVNELKDYTMLEGYYIWDEVLKETFDEAKQLQDYFKQYDPNRLANIIMLPSYGPYTWGDTNGNDYESFIDSYIETVDPDVLGFDYYPFWKIFGNNAEEASLIENDLWKDMGLFRKKSMEYLKPFWFYLQAVKMEVVNDKRTLGHMTKEKIGVQMKSALAYGAKAVSYFWTLDMLTDRYGNEEPIYNDIKSLNNEVMNLGNLLFDKQSKQIYHFGISEGLEAPYFLDDVDDGDLIASAPDNSIVSVFGDASSTAYVLVVNKDYKHPMTGELTLKVPGQVKRYDKTNDTSQVMPGLTSSIDLQIASGDAELYIIEPQTGGGYKQNQFFISTVRAVPWQDAYGYDDYLATFQATKEAGFNLIENSVLPKTKMLMALDACEAVQIKCLAQNITGDGFSGVSDSYPPFTEATVQSTVNELKDYTSLEGYYTWDEPLIPVFNVVKQVNDYFKKYDPNLLRYTVALPSYGPYTWYDTNGNSYEDYIDSYIETIDPDVLSFDYYPFWKIFGRDAEEASLIENDLWKDMGLFREKSIALNKPFWFYIQAVDMEVRNDTRLLGHITREKLSVQMKAALAYGAKTVSYFQTLDMLTDFYGTKRPIFDDVKSLNNEVMNLGNLLFDKQSKQIYHFGISEGLDAPYFLDDVDDGNLIASAPDNSIVSVFGDTSSTAYVLVVNKDYKHPMTGELTLKVPGSVKRYDKTNNTSQVMPGLTSSIDLQIASGDAELYMIEPVVDTEAPTWQTSSELTVSNVTQTGMKLSWPEAQDNVGVAGYRVYVDGVEKMDVSNQVLEQEIGNLTPNQTYTFEVKAYDAAGNESAGLNGSATTLQVQSGGGNSYIPSLSDNANLRLLQVSVGGEAVPLTPSFVPNTLTYSIETEAERAVVSANAAHAAAKVTLNGGAIGDGIEVKLQAGDNVFEVKVQAENGAVKTYTVNVHRKTVRPDQPEPEQPEHSLVTFTDIAAHWAESAIKQAVARRIVNGYSDKTFRPENPVTRAEFIVMLANALKLEGEGVDLTFTDRERIGSWAVKAVAQVVQLGVVNGYSDGSLRPNETITRVEMAAMIARALELPLAANSKTGFTDDGEIPQWAKSAVEAVKLKGIVAGRSGNRFAPQAVTTRAEAVTMLLRLVDKKG